jgi:hypothetical protein
MLKIICPNKKDPAWEKLVQAIGEAPAYISFFRNGNQIPDPATARAILGMKAAEPLKPKQSRSKSKKPKAPAPKATIELRPLIVPRIKADTTVICGDVPIKILELKRQTCENVMLHENKSYLPGDFNKHL